jgi:PKD repeat protein
VTARIRDGNGKEGSAQSTFVVTIFRAIADCAPTRGPRPLQVLFRDRGEFTAGSIVRYRWDFDRDGHIDRTDSVAIDPTFTFNSKGTYDALLEVTNNVGQTATDTCRVTVTGNPPRASAAANPSERCDPARCRLQLHRKRLGRPIALYEWDFESDGVYDFSGRSGTTRHVYPTIGTFVATCRVTDGDGERATSSVTIRPGPAGTIRVAANAATRAGLRPSWSTSAGTGDTVGR